MYRILSGDKAKLTKGRTQVINKFGFSKFADDFLTGIREVVGRKKE